MRKAKKSIHVEVVALSLFIGVLALYAVFSTFGSNANAAGAADAKCQKSWDKFKQEAIQKEDPDPVKYADGKNGAIPCTDDKGSTGHCNAVEGSQSPKVICGGEKDKNGNPASKEGLDKAKKAMEDGKKKEEPKGGGEGMKMPEMPKKEPKKEEPKDPNACPGGGTKKADGSCGNAPANPFAAIGKTASDLFKAFSEKFGGANNSGNQGSTPEEDLAKIAATPDLSTPQKEALQNYVTAARAVGNIQPVESLINSNKNRSVEDIEAGTSELQRYAESAGGDNPLVPTGSINPQSSGNIITTVGDWIKSWFGL